MADHAAGDADQECREHIKCRRDRGDADGPVDADEPDALRERVRQLNRIRGIT
jgi:hypothetical protein